jgi:hypothetical protein
MSGFVIRLHVGFSGSIIFALVVNAENVIAQRICVVEFGIELPSRSVLMKPTNGRNAVTGNATPWKAEGKAAIS